MSSFIVYALYRDDSDFLYVGQSTRGMSRPRAHFLPSVRKFNARFPVYKWLERHGGTASIAVLATCRSKKELNAIEKAFISYFRSTGTPLLNVTDGGEGTVGRKLSETMIRKLVDSRRDKPRVWTAEQRLALSKTKTGKKRKPFSIEHRQALSKARSGKPLTEAHKENMARGRKAANLTRKIPARVVEIRALLREGVTQVEIASRFGVTVSCVLNINANKTWYDPTWVPRKRSYGALSEKQKAKIAFTRRIRYGKLDEAAVAQIEMQLANGVTQRVLAEEFVVSSSTISDIKCGRTHVYRSGTP